MLLCYDCGGGRRVPRNMNHQDVEDVDADLLLGFEEDEQL